MSFPESTPRATCGRIDRPGSVESVRPPLRTIVMRALQVNASGLIAVHNHPSGVAEASESDRLLTQDMIAAIRQLGLKLLDHVIVAEGATLALQTAACWTNWSCCVWRPVIPDDSRGFRKEPGDMTDEQRQELIRLLQQGEDIAPEWARILFPPEKREYELVYHGKEREEDILANTLAVPLQPVRTFGKNEEDWHNMLVFGDNLQVMKSLLELKKTSQLCNADGTPGARLVYIDPPFATNVGVSGTQDQKAYQDKLARSQFVEFLRRRLILIRELLSSDGAIYVHLDQRKAHDMKVVLDEVLGKHGFVNELVWRRISAHNDADKYGPIHDTIFFYTASSDYVWNPQFAEVSEEYLNQFFDQVDETTDRPYARGDLTARGLRNGETGQALARY